MPGVVDPHTHLWLEGATADDPTSATAAAAAGGVTTCIDFCVQHPGESLFEAVASARRRTDGTVHVDYALHLTVTHLYAGWERDLERVVAEGVVSGKVYTTYKGTVYYADDETIRRLMTRSGAGGLLVQMHAENDDILEAAKRRLLQAGNTGLRYHAAARPAAAEEAAVERGLEYSRAARSPIYFVHLSSPRSVDLVEDARENGVPAIAETCPHFLAFDESVYEGPDALRFLMTPPIRSRDMSDGLWRRVRDGKVHAIGSDHCGFSLEQRGGSQRFDQVRPGIPGVETLLPVMYTLGVASGRLRPPQLVRLLATNPARIFGLESKGRLEPGCDADLVIFDPKAVGPLRDDELHGRSGFSPYAGIDLAGRVRTTISRGRVAYTDGRVVVPSDRGRFVPGRRFEAERAFDLG
jgi:dihydropyrimidinase